MLKFLSGLAISAVIAFYLLFNRFYSVNFPFLDDFSLLQFAVQVSKEKFSWSTFIQELFKTYNDHKAVIPKLVSYCHFRVNGYVDFRFCLFIVSANVTLIFALLYYQFRRMALPLYYFVPCAFLFFQPQFHDISNWALTGMQQSFLIVFVLCAISCAASGRLKGFYGSMLFCFLATFTFGSGIVSFTAVIFYFFCFRNYRMMLLTGIFMCAALVMYLVSYETGQEASIQNNVLDLFASLFAFIGSGVAVFGQHDIVSSFHGFFISAFVIAILVRKSLIVYVNDDRAKPATLELLAFFTFILVTATIVAVCRSRSGSVIASRFQIYAALSMVVFYLLLLDNTDFARKKSVWAVLTCASIFYWGYSYYTFAEVVAAKKTTYLADIFNWKNNRDMYSVEKTVLNNAAFYLYPAYHKGILKLPKAIIEKSQLEFLFQNEPVSVGETGIFVEDWNLKRRTRNGEEELRYFFIRSDVMPARKKFSYDRFLVLKNRNDGRIHLVQANPKIEAKRRILSGNYYRKGFNALFRNDDLSTGTYDLAILDVNNNKYEAFYKLDKSLCFSKRNYYLR
jgi:hypothetical protein